MGKRIEQAQWKCPRCQRVTVQSRVITETNHVAHILAVVFLCGLWLPMWILAAWSEGAGNWRCVECGYEHLSEKERRRQEKRLRKETRQAARHREKGGPLPRGEVIGGWGSLDDPPERQ